MKTTVIGMDIAKHVFQLHRVDPQTGEIARVKLKRTQVAPWFAQHPPCRVAMEACGGAHHWARTLAALGHTVTLLPPRAVRPFVQRNKTDAADAQAIWIASQQPGLRPVAVKTETQQSVLALHRLRAQLLKLRIMQTNALRGILSEFGHVLPEGHAALVVSLREQRQRVDHLQEDIDALEQRLQQSLRDTPACRRVAEIPGVRYPASGSSRPPRSWPPWVRPQPSPMAVSSRPGPGWCHARPAPVDASANRASASAATAICAHC